MCLVNLLEHHWFIWQHITFILFRHHWNIPLRHTRSFHFVRHPSDIPPRFLNGKIERGQKELSKDLQYKDTHFIITIVGLLLIWISILGMLHITLGQPTLTPIKESTEDLRAAGGVLGAIVGIPLVAWMAVVASSIILIGIGILGVSIATRSTFNLWFRLAGVLFKKLRQRPVRDLSLKRDKSLKIFARKNDNISDPLIINEEGSVKEENQAEQAKPEQAELKKLFNGAIKNKKETITKKETTEKKEQETKKERPLEPSTVQRKNNGWILPGMELLKKENIKKSKSDKSVSIKRQSIALAGALESHGVEATLTGWVIGPTVTRYELELDEGVKVASVTKLSKDIAYAMAAKDVRILAPIPGRKAIGVEVPNQDREVVLLGDNLATKEAINAKHPLEVALGKDINGSTIMLNLADTPHLLIAGATGAGKSSCLNTIITSLLMRCTPDEVRLILVDPKMVEMRQFENAPHLLAPPVVDPKKAANALGWAVREMDRRYEVLFTAGFRDIIGYNAAVQNKTLVAKEGEEEYCHMPYIVVVVDELADLMMVAARDVEDYICRIAQKARAIGIHLIVATQRPSTDIITGVIKANIPARMAFSVSSLVDSRVILDQVGAERLVGQGDMLLRLPTSSTMSRIQGAWISEEEVKNIIKFWSNQKPETDYIENLTEDVAPKNNFSEDLGDDELYETARELVVNTGLGSTSMLQRKLRVGFARAGRIMDMLEEKGIVGPSEGSKPREVLISAEN